VTLAPRSAALGGAVVVAMLAVATAREAAIGRTEADAADAAAARADWPDAIDHARAAAEAFVPAASWPVQGLRRLQAIGEDAEARGDHDTALLAYGAMKTATGAVSPWPGRADWGARADEGLARAGRMDTSSSDGRAPR
jgi:hypothetical protein